MKSVWKIILLAICGFVALSVISSPVSEAKPGMFDFVRKLVIHDAKKLKRIAKKIPASSVGRKIDPGDIKKSLPDIIVPVT